MINYRLVDDHPSSWIIHGSPITDHGSPITDHGSTMDHRSPILDRRSSGIRISGYPRSPIWGYPGGSIFGYPLDWPIGLGPSPPLGGGPSGEGVHPRRYLIILQFGTPGRARPPPIFSILRVLGVLAYSSIYFFTSIWGMGGIRPDRPGSEIRSPGGALFFPPPRIRRVRGGPGRVPRPVWDQSQDHRFSMVFHGPKSSIFHGLHSLNPWMVRTTTCVSGAPYPVAIARQRCDQPSAVRRLSDL